MRLDKYDETGKLGCVTIDTPTREVVAGARVYMEITYTAGETPIRTGGALRFRVPGLFDMGGRERAPVTCSRDDVVLRADNFLPRVNGKNGEEFIGTNRYLFVVLEEGELREGDTVTVSYGNIWNARGRLLPTWAQEWAVEVSVDPDGARATPDSMSGFALLPNPPTIDIVPGAPAKIDATVSSTAQTGESVTVMVRARDRLENVILGYVSSFDVHILSETGRQPADIKFRLNSAGVLQATMTIDQSGVYRLEIVDRQLGFHAISNPLRATDEEPAVRLYWGDTHCHSVASGDTSAHSGVITAAKGYDYARHISHLDFCTITDHSENLHVSPADWDVVRAAAVAAYEPGRFVSFSAYEATHQPMRRDGDKNVYFFDDEQPCLTEGDTEELYANLKKNSGDKVMVIPHLHQPTNWNKHDPELEHVVEVYSHWGCGLSPDSEPQIVPGKKRPPESFLTHALEQGARLGFICSADHSFGHPGDDFWWDLSSFNGGLAAVYGTELSREGVWNALKAKRCYGTTRARILLDFDLNGNPMGSEFVLSRQESRRLRVQVNGTCAIDTICIIRNNQILHSEDGLGRWDVEIDLEDVASERDVDYYYVHVQQRDGEQAWASPIWVCTERNDYKEDPNDE